MVIIMLRTVCICTVLGMSIILLILYTTPGNWTYVRIHANYVTNAEMAYIANSSESKQQLNSSSNTYKILYWTPSFHGQNWFGAGDTPFEKCHHKNCFLTSDREDYDTSDAILVNLHVLFMRPLPKYRASPDQKWIMRLTESPYFTAAFHVKTMLKYNGVFHATWTYHSKSDIWTSYNKWHFVNKAESEIGNYTEVNHTGGKDVIVGWIASHCETQSQREKYVDKLHTVVPVTVCGKCGPLKQTGENCTNLLSRSKFFLSFENSLCDEYVTEKLWLPILNGVVPIVMGAYNYSRILPPNSYIDVKDFKTVEDLGKHLLKVNSDDKLYNDYFAWKKTHKYVAYPPPQCALCEYMNQNTGKVKTYTNLDRFWNRHIDCDEPGEFYNNADEWT